MIITLRNLKKLIHESLIIENSSAVTDDSAKEIMKKFPKGLKKIGIDTSKLDSLKVLGTGTRGTAFLVSNDRVFKVTNDDKEAQAASLIQGKNEKSLVRIYAVVHFADTPYYGILQEKLNPLPDDIGKEYNNALVKTLVPVWIAKSNGSWETVKELTKKHIKDQIAKKNLNKEDMDEYVKSVNSSWNMLINKFYIRDMFETLQKLGIRFHDFHAGNLMTRDDGQLVLIDLGMSKVSGTGNIENLTEIKL